MITRKGEKEKDKKTESEVDKPDKGSCSSGC